MKKYEGDRLDCLWSLAQAVQQAGGMLSDDILDMPLREAISDVLGQNHIAFVWTKPEDQQ